MYSKRKNKIKPQGKKSLMKQRPLIYLIKISKVMVIKMLAKLTRLDEFSENFNKEREKKKIKY